MVGLNGTATSLLAFNGSDVAAGSTIATFTSTGGNNGSSDVAGVSFELSGFSLLSGEQIALRRNSAGDLVVNFTPVPESAFLLLASGVCLLLMATLRRLTGNVQRLLGLPCTQSYTSKLAKTAWQVCGRRASSTSPGEVPRSSTSFTGSR